MGYKMPIVCKKIVLPCNKDLQTGANNAIPLAEYREKYGIDLQSVLKLKIVLVDEGEGVYGVRGELPKDANLFLSSNITNSPTIPAVPVTIYQHAGDFYENMKIGAIRMGGSDYDSLSNYGLCFTTSDGIIKVYRF